MKTDSTPSAAETATDKPEEIVRVYHSNRGQGSFVHGDYRLDPGSHCDVPKSVADKWLAHKVGGQPAAVLRDEEITPRVSAIEEENALLKAEFVKLNSNREEHARRANQEAERARLAENKVVDAEVRLANLEKMLAELKAAGANGGASIPVTEDLKEGETPNPQTVFKGDALKAEQAKAAQTQAPKRAR